MIPISNITAALDIKIIQDIVAFIRKAIVIAPIAMRGDCNTVRKIMTRDICIC